MLKQQKWLSTNHTLSVNDIVLIMDLRNRAGYPRHGRIKEIIQDSAGENRYYLCEYKLSQKKYGTVKRTAHSLVVVYKMSEQEADEQKYLDFIDIVEEKDLENSKQEQKVRKNNCQCT